MKRPWIAASAALLLTGSCATLSEDQCRTGDWGGIGYNDGSAGYTADRLGSHAKACAEYGIAPDQAAYMTGRARGLTVYCQPGKGFYVGRTGGSYAGVCPASLEGAFLDGYNDGRVVWDAQQRLNRAENDIREGQARWDEAERRLKEEEARLADPATPDSDKAAIRETLKRLRDDRRQADEDIRAARYRRDEAGREINQLRYTFSPTYGGW